MVVRQRIDWKDHPRAWPARFHRKLLTIFVMAAAPCVFAGNDPSAPIAAQDSVELERDLLDGVSDKLPVQNWEQNSDEARAYNYVLVKAGRAAPAALAAKGRRDLTYAHLMEEPSKYRGVLFHGQGRLRRLIKYDAPKMAAVEGVATVYEAWIFGAGHYNNPMCVLFSEAPPGIPIGEKLDVPVAFDAYFFKRYRYQAADAVRDAPLLIGRAPVNLLGQPTPEPKVADLLSSFVGFGVVTVLSVLLLAWWLWHSDRKVRATLARARAAAPLILESEVASQTHSNGHLAS
jgi:hypothetical protein